MTTRWKQKASMALIVIGIICVFLLIILLWSAISNGMLRTKSTSSISSSLSSLSSSLSFTSSTPSFVLISSDIELDNNSQRQQKQQQKFIQSSLETNMIDTVLDDDDDDDNIQQHKNHHQKLLSQDIINLDDYITEEFIKPIKLHHLPLLHTDDLLYESIKYKNRTYDDKNYNNGNNDDGGYKFTGNYRSKTNKIWDPHPEYDIKAFGHNMHLILYQDGSFVPDTFKVTNVYRNRTEIHIDNHKNDIACHYRGNVLGDEESAVAVSLCEGMTGHIKTSFGSFFIQPIEKYETNNKNDENNNSTEILHRIWREPIKQRDERKQSLRQYSKNYHNCPLEEHMKGQHRNNFKDLSSLSSISSTFSTFQRDHDENQQQQQQQQHSRKKRNIYNSNDHQYTLEVLIAIDRKMSEFHGEHKIKHYVLTLMSIVSNIFADASIGNSINVAVVNIMVLKENLSLEYIEEGVYASHLLKKFCSFMQKRSDHYDTAILLTREQICRNTTEKRCDTLGLAELGTVCKRHSCSIVQDNGLSAAFTIAHELGHILNMPHDDDEKCSKFEKHGKRMLNIMSSTMGDEIHPWSWSDCSRHFVTEFLEQDDVSCMEDTPTEPYKRTTKKLPGELFDLDQQCELIHGPGAIYCSSNTDNECGRLWCYDIISNSCRSINLPWADGTPCYDSYHWCQKGECVNRDRKHLRPIDGGWGPWGPYSPCSRTCGGGVQESLRECNNPVPQNGGRYCLGNHKRYRSCQTEDCPPESMDFREKQCFDLNGNNFDLPGIPRSVKWIPKYGVSPKEECKLHCRIKGSNAYFQLVDKVVDGTTCSFDSFNKCVNGICRPAACDNVLYSNAKLDRCGVCEGDNSTCVEISKVFYKSDLDRKPPSRSKIYYHVVTIPKGASNVVITQPGYPLTNYIVLLDDEGKYLINGDNIINTFSRSIPYDGVTLNYTGSDSILEKVVTTYARKLRKDLVVEILSLPKEEQTENTILMTYSYTISTDHPHYYSHYQHHNQNQHFSDRYHYIQRQHHNSQQHHHPYHNNINNNNNNNNYHVNSYDKEREMITYRWDVDQWSPCDSLCNGKKYRSIVCIQIDARHKVDDTYCNNIPKPSYDLQSSCNTDCEIVRELENVSECSAPCEKRGVQYKSYKCIQKYSHTNYSTIIDRSYCEVKHSMKTEEECIGSCSNWTYTEWTPCSLTCSWNRQIGKQTRSVVCIKNGKIVDDLHCSPTRRYHFNDVMRPCNTEPCPYEYSYGEETPCSVTCGIGQRTTAIYCKQNNQIVDKILCAGKPMLSPIIRNCTMPPCHNNTRQQRRKRPLKHVPQSRHIYSDRNHNNPAIFNKPIISNLDFMSWETGEWSMCNRDNCQRNRTVYCKDSTKYSCPENRKPESTQNCCKIKYVQKWSPCSVDCGIGIRRKEFICARVSQPLLNGEKRFKIPIDPQYCRSLHLKLPNPKKRIKNCKKKFCKWVTGPWSQCTCNTQTPLKTRVVNCKNVNGDIVEQRNCNTSEKPENIVNCTSCTSEANIRIEKVYSQCSCDGRRKRRIICYDQNNKHTKCPEGPQYESSSRDSCTPPEECLPHSCVEVRRKKRILDDGNYLISINKRPIKIYCHNMTGRPQEYINVNSSENLSIYYHKRSIDIDNCPTQSRNNEYDDSSIPSGSTSFDKIAINLSTMRIIEDDYTFATITGKPQPYGSAGDCYNRSKNCPQGYFSINLKDTGFRIHSKIKWDTDGHYSTIDFVQKLEYPYQVVKAYCGGYCGKCSISKDTNLILDVV